VKRERRAEIVRLTTKWVAGCVESLPAVDNGLYEVLDPDSDEERALAVKTVESIAKMIQQRVRTW
jgi:hypothetical protein